MKKFLLSVMIGAMAFAGSAMAEKARIASEGAYAPWNYMDDSGKLAGFEIDLGNDLCQRAGLECEWIVNEWDTIIPNLIAGNYDAIMAGMSITDERKQSIDFSDDYFPPDPSRYAAAKGAEFDFANLKDKKIGVQGGTIQANYAEQNFKDGNQILSYETGDQSIADLAAGNVDMVLADGAFLEPVVEGSNGAIVFVGEDVMLGGGVGIGLRKGDALGEKLQAALAEAKADGTVDKLIMEYFKKGPFYTE
ncbi:MAG: transporter substrate-binding domain-containing protein [Gammaproteobacteria bacterium]|nr:transporter substrate-binding domain-containing protein [Gammaproteobacteria bacterium]